MKFVRAVCFCISYLTADNLLPVTDHCQPTSYTAAPSHLLICHVPPCPLSQYISHPTWLHPAHPIPTSFLLPANLSLTTDRATTYPLGLPTCSLCAIYLPSTYLLLDLCLHQTYIVPNTYLLATYFHTYLLPTSDFLLTYLLPTFCPPPTLLLASLFFLSFVSPHPPSILFSLSRHLLRH